MKCAPFDSSVPISLRLLTRIIAASLLLSLVAGCSGEPEVKKTPIDYGTPTPESLFKDHKAQGEVALDAEYWDAAAKSFENAKEIKPDDPEVREKLIFSYHKADNKMSRNSRAYKAAKELLEIDPGNKKAKSFVGELKAIKELKKADWMLHKHQFKEAKALLTKAKKLSPHSAKVRFALFEAIANTETPSKTSASYKECKKALELGLDGPQAAYAKMWLEGVDNGMTNPTKSITYMVKALKESEEGFMGLLLFYPKDTLARGKRGLHFLSGNGRQVSQEVQQLLKQLRDSFKAMNVVVLGETAKGNRSVVKVRTSYTDGRKTTVNNLKLRKEDGLWKMDL